MLYLEEVIHNNVCVSTHLSLLIGRTCNVFNWHWYCLKYMCVYLVCIRVIVHGATCSTILGYMQLK